MSRVYAEEQGRQPHANSLALTRGEEILREPSLGGRGFAADFK